MNTTDGRETGRLAAERVGTAGGRSGRREQLFVVRVRDCCCAQLVGRDGGSYQSPPQPLADAQALIALLIERNHEQQVGEGELSLPIAGGRRTISLEPAR